VDLLRPVGGIRSFDLCVIQMLRSRR